MARKPRLMSRPTLAPRISNSALVVMVVPWEKNSMPDEIDAARGKVADAAHDAERGIFRRRRHLLDGERAVGNVEQHQVGMGAADVDAQSIFLRRHRSDARSLNLPGQYAAARDVPPGLGSQSQVFL